MIIKNFKKLVFSLEKRFPFLGEKIITVFRFLRFSFFYKPYFLFLKIKNSFSKKDSYKIYWINPEKIVFTYDVSKVKINYFTDRGKIISGDWDLSKEKFEDFLEYQCLKERFIERKKWEETSLYKEKINRINKGEIISGCCNVEKLEKFLDYIDKLYESIKNNGYLLSSENIFLSKYNKNDQSLAKLDVDEVTVNIGRNGEILFFDGKHRLSIAKILKIKKIPVMIIVRHKEWVEKGNWDIKESQ